MKSFFTFLNAAALLGWSAVLIILLTNSLINDRSILVLLFVLESICLVEVGRIAFGRLRGNLVLGSVLHFIRMTCLTYVLPAGLLRDVDRIVAVIVLYSWSITEVTRYPMYLFPTSASARHLRLVVPLFTFPPGCAAECYGAYRAFTTEWNDDGGGGGGGKDPIKLGLLGMMMLINGLLGPTMAYPALLKKGLPMLIGKKVNKNRGKEE